MASWRHNFECDISYLGTSWHVTQIIIAEEGMDRCSLWIAKNLRLGKSVCYKQFGTTM